MPSTHTRTGKGEIYLCVGGHVVADAAVHHAETPVCPVPIEDFRWHRVELLVQPGDAVREDVGYRSG